MACQISEMYVEDMCKQCEGETSVFCKSCKNNYCTTCSILRHQIGKRREHELIRLSTVAKENVAHVSLEMEEQCTQLSHPGKVQIFCFDVKGFVVTGCKFEVRIAKFYSCSIMYILININ